MAKSKDARKEVKIDTRIGNGRNLWKSIFICYKKIVRGRKEIIIGSNNILHF